MFSREVSCELSFGRMGAFSLFDHCLHASPFGAPCAQPKVVILPLFLVSHVPFGYLLGPRHAPSVACLFHRVT